jgi:hypothetical protein
MRSKIALWCVATTLLALTAIPVLAAGRGWLGVTTQSTTDELKRGLDLTTDGLLVNDVSDGSPADKAGMKKGDVILTYNWKAVSSPDALRELVRSGDPGKSVSLGLWRDGAKVAVQVTLGEVPSSGNDDDYDTPAQKAGLRAGDVIVKVGADSVDTPAELARAVNRNEGKTSLTVLRKGAKREVQVDLGEREETHTYWRGGGDSDDLPRNPEPGPGPRVYRWNTKDDGGDEADLREEMLQLKQELRELRDQMAKPDTKSDAKPKSDTKTNTKTNKK